jgi:hypothetical protein
MRVQIQNANGIQGKSEEILRVAKANNIDIIATTETWLARNSQPPIRPFVANTTTTNTGYITGGKRHSGGILVNTITPPLQPLTRHTRTALNGSAVVIETPEVILIFVYLPPKLPHSIIDELLTFADQLAGLHVRNRR